MSRKIAGGWGVPDISGLVPVDSGGSVASSGVDPTNRGSRQGLRRWWRALSGVLAGALVAAGLPLLAHPAAATEWTPGDAWDLGSTNAAVDGRPFNGQVSLYVPAAQTNQRFDVFVDAGGTLEVRMLAIAAFSLGPEGVAVIRVTSPQGQVFYAEQAFDGRNASAHGADAIIEVILGVDEPLTSDIAGVWSVELFKELHLSTSTAAVLRWDIVPRDADGTVHQGRVWTDNYRRSHSAIHLNNYVGDTLTFLDGIGGEDNLAGRSAWDQSAWIWSADGLLLRVDDMGFNSAGAASFWATSQGLVDAECQPLRRSRPTSGPPQSATSLDDALNCGVPLYRVFTEHPDLTMPDFAQYPDGTTQRINFPLTMPSVDSIGFTQTGTGNVYDGLIAVTLSGQPTTVRVEIDTDGDGNFDGAGDRVLFEEWTLQPGTTNLHWDGLDANGLPVALGHSVGVRVTMLSSFETHVVANSVHQRLGGIRLTALNGPLAGSDETRYLVNWDDSDPSFFDADGGRLCGGINLACTDTDLFPESVTGTRVDSRDGVHRWGRTFSTPIPTWGSSRDIVTWQVADLSAEAVIVVITEPGPEVDQGNEIEHPGAEGDDAGDGSGDDIGDNTGDLDVPGNVDDSGEGNLGGGQEVPADPDTPADTGADAPAAGPGVPVRTPARLPLTGVSGIWIVGAGLAVVGGLLLALSNCKFKAATAATNE